MFLLVAVPPQRRRNRRQPRRRQRRRPVWPFRRIHRRPGSTPQQRRPPPRSAVISPQSLLRLMVIRRRSPAVADRAVEQRCRASVVWPSRAVNTPLAALQRGFWLAHEELSVDQPRSPSDPAGGAHPAIPSRSTVAKSEVSTDGIPRFSARFRHFGEAARARSNNLLAGGPGGASARRTERRARRRTRGTRSRPTVRSPLVASLHDGVMGRQPEPPPRSRLRLSVESPRRPTRSPACSLAQARARTPDRRPRRQARRTRLL